MIRLNNVTRKVISGGKSLTILDNINLEIQKGEFVAIVGASGSGKTSLMNVIGCIDREYTGGYAVNGQTVSDLSDSKVSDLRNRTFGYIFQNYYLIPDITVRENVEIPMFYANSDAGKKCNRAEQLLAQVGLEPLKNSKPSALSGGEQQRVAIARALANGGQVILADEPTGALDSHRTQEIMTHLSDLSKAGHTIVLITHDPQIAEYADRTIELKDGQIILDQQTKKESEKSPLNLPQNQEGKRKRFNPIWMVTMAMRMILAQKLRAGLTMLGVIIGIICVTVIIELSSASQRSIREFILQNSHLITIYLNSFEFPEAQNFTTDQINLATEISGVETVYSTHQTSMLIRKGHQHQTGLVNAVANWNASRLQSILIGGKMFQPYHGTHGAPPAIINRFLLEDAFNFKNISDVLGKRLFIGNQSFEIIGIADEGFPSETLSLNDRTWIVWVPQEIYLQRILFNPDVDNLTVVLKNSDQVEEIRTQLSRLLQDTRRQNDFIITTTQDSLDQANFVGSIMDQLLRALATPSLITSGIGVMNVTYMAMTERINEIGIRRAVGATRWHIMGQFVIEASTICGLAGVIAVLLAYAIAATSSFLFAVQNVVITPSTIVTVLAISIGLGIGFSALPAMRASRVNIVRALGRSG